MTDHGCVTRRSFLKRAASGAAVVAAAPYFVTGSALGRSGTVPANERITLGLIGCGHHAIGWNLAQIFRCADAQVVAVCDVDARHMAAAVDRVDAHYAEVLGRREYSGCARYADFRELIARPDIDAVVNVTPDHWHVLPSVMAARAGKDVICEKPLSLTVAEGRVLCDVIAQTGSVFQTASENRSIDSYIQMCELVRNGRIGQLKHVTVSLPSGNESRGDNFMDRVVQPPPEWFNYEMWLGQAPLAPYSPARCHGSYRWIFDYSGGRLTDWGAHLIDLAQWANDSDGAGPVSVEGVGRFPSRDALFNTAEEFELRYRYANGVNLTVVSKGPGIRFEGTEGWIGSDGWRGPLEASRTAILDSTIGPNEIHLHRPSEVIPRTEGRHGGEVRDFLDCVKSRETCYAPAETGHRTATISHIGNIAMLLGRPLRWDPEAERFADDAQANAMLSRHQRVPWTLANVDGWLKGAASL
jgi:predicted dehydrogenase